MYSTSLGNSVMTSTSCSRGRQKLRFQISRKVRTARDGDRDYKEVPREAEPSRAAAGAGAAAAGGPAAITEHKEAKDHLVLPVSPSPYCSHHCAPTATPAGSFSLYPPALSPAQAFCSPPASATKGLPRSSHLARPDSRPWGFPAGRAEAGCSHLGPRTPEPEGRQLRDWAALRFGPQRCPGRARGIQVGPSLGTAPRCLPGCHHWTPEVTQRR